MTGRPLIASSRMYDAAPPARAGWHALLRAAHASAGLQVDIVEHRWPTPIGELWDHPGLCGAFMCGWPFASARRAGRAFTAVASVVPDWPAYAGLPRYRSEFLVREESSWTALDDALGSRYGWMVRDSQSGWNAPRAALAALADIHGPVLFGAAKGPYGNPRGLLRALKDKEIDLTAADGWYLDLLRTHDPAALAGIRTLAFTPWTPNPLLASGPDVDPDASRRLSEALLNMHDDARLMPLLREARVAKFARADPQAYDVLLDIAASAARSGYAEIR